MFAIIKNEWKLIEICIKGALSYGLTRKKYFDSHIYLFYVYVSVCLYVCACLCVCMCMNWSVLILNIQSANCVQSNEFSLSSVRLNDRYVKLIGLGRQSAVTLHSLRLYAIGTRSDLSICARWPLMPFNDLRGKSWKLLGCWIYRAPLDDSCLLVVQL